MLPTGRASTPRVRLTVEDAWREGMDEGVLDVSMLDGLLTAIVTHSTYLRPLSVTCAIDPDARAPAVRALHESLVETPLAVRA